MFTLREESVSPAFQGGKCRRGEADTRSPITAFERHTMRKRLAAYLTLFISTFNAGSGFAEHSVVRGVITSDTTWSADTVMLDSSVIVESNATLTLEPGIVVKGEYKQYLLVHGRLLATGTPDDSIIFTSASRTLRWFGIRFVDVKSSSDTSRIDYCRVEEGESEWGASLDDCHGGGITTKNCSKIVVSHSTISHNGGNGLYWGGGVYCVSANPRFFDCRIEENSIDGVGCRGAGMCLDASSPHLENVVFRDNFIDGAGVSGAGLACRSASSPTLVNCLFTRNTSKSNEGGALVCEDGSNPRVINCTFAKNRLPNTSGRGQALLMRSSSPKFINCIVAFSSRPDFQVMIADTASHPIFTHCLLDTAMRKDGPSINVTGTFSDVLYADPMFVDTGAGDFRLKAGSPCIDAGTPDTQGIPLTPFDLAGNGRIFNNVRIDIGAYEWQGQTPIVKEQQLSHRPPSSNRALDIHSVFSGYHCRPFQDAYSLDGRHMTAEHRTAAQNIYLHLITPGIQ